jgi:hypothetical protein
VWHRRAADARRHEDSGRQQSRLSHLIAHHRPVDASDLLWSASSCRCADQDKPSCGRKQNSRKENPAATLDRSAHFQRLQRPENDVLECIYASIMCQRSLSETTFATVAPYSFIRILRSSRPWQESPWLLPRTARLSKVLLRVLIQGNATLWCGATFRCIIWSWGQALGRGHREERVQCCMAPAILN